MLEQLEIKILEKIIFWEKYKILGWIFSSSINFENLEIKILNYRTIEIDTHD